MRTCQQFVTATDRCGKPAVVTELMLGAKQDLCAMCAWRMYYAHLQRKPK